MRSHTIRCPPCDKFRQGRSNFAQIIMAQRLFSSVGKVGIGLAVVGGVVQSALYNGKMAIHCLV